uniref:BTB domain-containing protein n=1 Tax=Globodera rostochiensis TaxID=31243 RepID=A0A914HM79_GLORO
MEIFDNYIIVDEKAMTDINLPAGTSKFRDLGAFASLEFTGRDYHQSQFAIKDFSGVSQTPAEPLAQIVLWKWSQGTQFAVKKIILNRGRTTEWISIENSIVIRILKKREPIENPCPPLSSPDDDLTVNIGKDCLVVSAHRLMSVSPVINRMLSVDMKEKQQKTINLDRLGINMEQFMDFLEAISISSYKHSFFPNPKNVLDLLKLADYFQVDWLKECYGIHLMNCVEIPFMDRFLLVERYRLDNLKQFFSRMLTEMTNRK